MNPLNNLPAADLKAFVLSANTIIQSLLVPTTSTGSAAQPSNSYGATPTLVNEAPSGGWIADSELRNTAQKVTEAITLEKWLDGALFAIKFLSAVGAL